LGRLERVSRAGFHPSDAAMTLVEQLQSIAAGDDQALLRLFEINLAGQLTHRHLTVMDQWSMAWGVELRVPFVDPAVIDLAHTLPLAHRVDRRISFGKLVLREWALQTGSPALKEIAMRPKIGLPTSSYRHRERFTKLCDQELPDDYLADHPLRALFDRKRDVLMFELFREIYINRRGAHPGAMSVLEFMETQKSPVRERRAAH
jgi:asparagine synthase (glutamine-hydrolysing)